jgi:hypothetical protein
LGHLIKFSFLQVTKIIILENDQSSSLGDG